MKSDRVIVEKIVNGGYGLARHSSGKILLLSNALPGEEVSYTVLSSKRNVLFGEVTKIHSAHKGRILPPCIYYNQCGGCNMQHSDYQTQLRMKNDILQDIFSPSTERLTPIVSSPLAFGYRQRIRLHVSKGKVGFNRFQSNQIAPISSCMIAHKMINDQLPNLVNSPHFLPLLRITFQIEIHYDPGSTNLVIVFQITRKSRPADRNNVYKLSQELPPGSRVFFKGINNLLEGPFSSADNDSHTLSFQYSDKNAEKTSRKLSWEIGGFSQVNLEQNQNLIEYAVHTCSSGRPLRILDLFCGMGNFSIPLAARGHCVTGVEGQRSSIRSAKRNRNDGNSLNAEFIQGNINDVCKLLIDEKRKFDIVLLDPPRQGMASLHRYLPKLTNKTIIYISCDPATLNRDIVNMEKEEFQLISLQPFDMFPQTHHIETVAVFKKQEQTTPMIT